MITAEVAYIASISTARVGDDTFFSDSKAFRGRRCGERNVCTILND